MTDNFKRRELGASHSCWIELQQLEFKTLSTAKNPYRIMFIKKSYNMSALHFLVSPRENREIAIADSKEEIMKDWQFLSAVSKSDIITYIERVKTQVCWALLVALLNCSLRRIFPIGFLHFHWNCDC